MDQRVDRELGAFVLADGGKHDTSCALHPDTNGEQSSDNLRNGIERSADRCRLRGWAEGGVAAIVHLACSFLALIAARPQRAC